MQNSSTEFCELWERHDVMAPGTAHKFYRHPEVGELRMLASNLWLEPNSASPHVVTYSPADEATAAKLPLLAGEPIPAL